MCTRLFHVHHEPQAHAFRGPCAFDLPAAQRLSLGMGATARAPRAPLSKGIIPKVHKVSSVAVGSIDSIDEVSNVTGPVPKMGALRVAKPRGICPDEI